MRFGAEGLHTFQARRGEPLADRCLGHVQHKGDVTLAQPQSLTSWQRPPSPPFAKRQVTLPHNSPYHKKT